MKNDFDCARVREESLPQDKAGVEALLEELSAEQLRCRDHIRTVLAGENPAAGVFMAGELHRAKQYNVLLQFRIDFCRARLKRLAEQADRSR